MAKLQLLFVLLSVLCGVLHLTAEHKSNVIEEVEEVKKDDEALQKEEPVENDDKVDKPDLGVKEDAKPLFRELFGGLGNLVEYLFHGAHIVGTAIIGFTAGALKGALTGVGELIDGTIEAAIEGAIHINGHGLKDEDQAKAGWNHPVQVKNNGYCHSVSHALCNKMSNKENGHNAHLSSSSSAHLGPVGCYVRKENDGKQSFWFNKYPSTKECSEKRVCVCEVCARMTSSGKCCNLPFLFERELRGNCIKRDCTLGFFCKHKCGVTDVVGKADDLEVCISQDQQMDIDKSRIGSPKKACNGRVTQNGNCCHFPFKFKGKTETTCIKTNCGIFSCDPLKCGVTAEVDDIKDLELCATEKKDAPESDAPRISNVQDVQAVKERILDAFVHKVEKKLLEKLEDMTEKATEDEHEEHEEHEEE